jgi:hypothetical protein
MDAGFLVITSKQHCLWRPPIAAARHQFDSFTVTTSLGTTFAKGGERKSCIEDPEIFDRQRAPR